MKMKGDTNSEAPAAFVNALNCLRAWALVAVLRDCFGIPLGTFRSAAFYLQEADLCREHPEKFVNFTLSYVTYYPHRDFERARQVIEAKLIELVEEHWPDAEVEVMVVIAVSPPKRKWWQTIIAYFKGEPMGAMLIETPDIIIAGKKKAA